MHSGGSGHSCAYLVRVGVRVGVRVRVRVKVRVRARVRVRVRVRVSWVSGYKKPNN